MRTIKLGDIVLNVAAFLLLAYTIFVTAHLR